MSRVLFRTCHSLVPLILIFFCCCVVPATAMVDYVDDEDLEEAVRVAEQELLIQKEKINQVQASLDRQQAAADSARQREVTLLDELASFDEQIMEESRLLVEYFQQTLQQKEMVKEKEQIYTQVQIEKETLRLMTQRRLAAYYRMGDFGVLNITFSSTSLPELVNFHEYYHHLLRYDHELIQRFRAKIAELEEAHEAQLEQRKKLTQAMAQARAQRDALAVAKEERRELLARVQAEKNLHKDASRELALAVDTLMVNLQELEKQADGARQKQEEWMISSHPIQPFKKRKPAWLRGFAGQKGLLSPPVEGEVVAVFQSVSGEQKGLGSDIPYGIDFKVEQGAQVRAVFRGKVIYAGFVKGYGQVVIVSHTDGYYTLTSGLNSFLVEKGDAVQEGDVLGLASIHVGLLVRPIHFEIRQKTTVLDPLEWLALGGEGVAEEKSDEP